MFHNQFPLIPKIAGGPLRVILVGRISTVHQNEESIEASFASDEAYLRERYSGPVEIIRLGERGGGWKLNRETIIEAERLIQTRQFDVVIMEDIGRAYRNPQFQFRLAQLCKDHGTRLICPGDVIDTAEPHWEVALQTAVLRHGLHVPDTRRRVRRSATYSFHKGGMVLKIRSFYQKLSAEEAKGGVRIAKREEFQPIVKEMRLRVLRGDSYERIARWLNSMQIQAGPYVTIGRWTGRLVNTLLRARILYGLRTFRELEHELIYSTGEHRKTPNANPETEMVPELAFMTEEEHSEMIAVMDARAAEYERGKGHRANVARKESFWPGQHLLCSCCGARMYWAGRSVLRCMNAYPGRPQTCWNRLLVDADLLRRKLLPLLLAELHRRPRVYRAFIDSVWDSFQRAMSAANGGVERLEGQLRTLNRQIDKLTKLIIRLPDSEALLAQLKESEDVRKSLRLELKATKETLSQEAPTRTREDLEQNLESSLLRLSETSYEFAALLRATFPDLSVVPVVAVGTDQVRPRVRWNLPPDPEAGIGPTTLSLDAFECSAAITHARTCERLHREHPDWTCTRIGEELGLSKQVAAKALKYARLLIELGVNDPFVEMTEPPAKASRWKKRAVDEDDPSA